MKTGGFAWKTWAYRSMECLQLELALSDRNGSKHLLPSRQVQHNLHLYFIVRNGGMWRCAQTLRQLFVVLHTGQQFIGNRGDKPEDQILEEGNSSCTAFANSNLL